MEKIMLSHGSGGSLMHRLLDSFILKELDNPVLREKKDSGLFKIGNKTIALTTDSYVINPIFFPGGDIGSLAVYGTVNDLAVCGARPMALSLGLIIEEGLDRVVLERIIRSIKIASKRADVQVVTGDTKVVEKGLCDSIYINTSGIGEIYYKGLSIGSIRAGDAVIVSGTIGEHAVSVLSKREGIAFGSNIRSDSAPLNGLISKILASSIKVRFMRDPTRGGVATTLNEIVKDRSFSISLDENMIPVRKGVREACELLGFDPLYLACEGRVIAVVPEEDAARAVRVMKKYPSGKTAAIIGRVSADHRGKVYMRTSIGGKRIVDMLSGEQLPRIC